ncbi:GntR family transcriptional regulator [Rhodococcus sp. NPDC059968]|uniref:GntR family transcriptional regulator n=1 Tax=Rhodococcus sp. NPDC059968 TaxID=3347017 RepID=UPI00366D54D3
MEPTSHELGRVANFQRRQLSEDVATYVRELIISGKVPPGEFLRTEPIAEAVGVSNTPVREGLLLLRGEGLVVLVPRRGFMVASITRQDVRDLFWAQAALAGELAYRVAREISAEQLKHLSDVVEQHHQAVDAGDKEKVIALGHEFHRTINLASDSRRLATLLGSIVQQLPNRFYNSIEGRVDCVLHDHPAILEALKKRRVKIASSLMREHILRGADRFIASLESQGMWAAEEEEVSTA